MWRENHWVKAFVAQGKFKYGIISCPLSYVPPFFFNGSFKCILLKNCDSFTVSAQSDQSTMFTTITISLQPSPRPMPWKQGSAFDANSKRKRQEFWCLPSVLVCAFKKNLVTYNRLSLIDLIRTRRCCLFHSVHCHLFGDQDVYHVRVLHDKKGEALQVPFKCKNYERNNIYSWRQKKF